jgi:hypothetical protein
LFVRAGLLTLSLTFELEKKENEGRKGREKKRESKKIDRALSIPLYISHTQFLFLFGNKIKPKIRLVSL